MNTAYREAAARAGLLRSLAGAEYVAGESADPLLGTSRWLVEYADDRILDDPALLDAMLTELGAEHTVLLRTEGDRVLTGPWTRRLTYLRLDEEPTAGTSALHCGPEADGDGPLVAEWLARALLAGEATADPADVRAAVAAIRDAPDRRTLVVRRGTTTIGHATLLTDAYDEATGDDFVDLVDILVDSEPDRRDATAQLVAASWRVAAELGRPLVGNVVHHSGGQRVLDSLLRRGWTVCHTYWTTNSNGSTQVLRTTGPAASA
ncbi:hypothetical protein GCM10022243_58150 [Saccharothrix violaceirubra]|uniref:N-acetyltransferase domain-containing protein n=1 Tax=Saccharothrix violaceirubra TaxID=413306 RepID=A0A7W7T3A6_9PSEU|nr:hypothetical protein [Saccharothrix violaceirubra]MBB4965754.1 hypothetical protein [Saccharothrix violaceirubra]